MEIQNSRETTPLSTTSLYWSDPKTRLVLWTRQRNANNNDIIELSSRVKVRHFAGANKVKRNQNVTMLRTATWNVGTMNSKSLELKEILQRRRIDMRPRN